MNLDKQWENASTPKIGSMNSEFDVKILTGIFRPWSWQFHEWKKKIERWGGHNIQRSGLEDVHCGYFYLHYQQEALLLRYCLSKNSKIWQRLTDHIKQNADGTFLGKIYMRWLGKDRFMGYFTLTKIED